MDYYEIIKFMEKYMRVLISIIFLFCSSSFFFSCNVETEENKEKLIFDTVINYYKQVMGKDVRIEEELTDSLVTLKFYGKYFEEDTEERWLYNVFISLDTSSLIFGDLNEDKLEDALMTVCSEGGGGGGNVTQVEFVVLLKTDNSYEVTDNPHSKQLSGCSESTWAGDFFPSRIENGFVIGNSYCLGKNDHRWDTPSKLPSKVILKNNKLSFHSFIK